MSRLNYHPMHEKSLFGPVKVIYLDIAKTVLSEYRVRLVPLNMLKSFNIFTDCSKVMLILWILFVVYVSHLPLICCLVCSLQHCDHMLGMDLPLGSLASDVCLCFRHLPI